MGKSQIRTHGTFWKEYVLEVLEREVKRIEYK